MQQTGVSVMLGLLQQIVDALLNDDRESAAELVDDLNRQLARERAAGTRREGACEQGKDTLTSCDRHTRPGRCG